MGKSSAPPPPDYRGMAEEQAQASREITEQQTYANRPDQFTPFGSTTWENTPVWDEATQQYINRWAQNTELDPLAQASLDEQMKLQLEKSQLSGAMTGRMWDEYGQPMNWDQHPDMAGTPIYQQGGSLQTAGVDPSGLRPGGQDVDPSQRYQQSAEDAIYGRSTSRLDPMFEQRQADMESSLYAKGLRPGDEAYDREMGNFNMQREDAYQTAMTEAIMGSGAEASRMHGMDLQTGAYDQGRRQQQFSEMLGAQGFNNEEIARMWQAQEGQNEQMFGNEMVMANYQNQLRQQSMAEEMQRRGFTLNEINAVMSGQQVGMPSMPGFTNATKSETPQYLEAGNMGYQAALQQSSADAASSPLGGLFSMASTVAPLMMPSDRRLKKNVRWIGMTPGGNRLYSWIYVWGDAGVGVMADEVPEAAVMTPSGYYAVDYSKVT